MNEQHQVGPVPAVSGGMLDRFDALCPDVEAEVVRLCMENDSPRATMGEDAEKMLQSGMRFVSKMLRATMRWGAGEMIADEVDWGRTRLPVYGVSAQMVFRNFQRYEQALMKRLTAEETAGRCRRTGLTAWPPPTRRSTWTS
jgi:hypothetical protein